MGEQSLSCKYPGEESYADTFYTGYQHPHADQKGWFGHLPLTLTPCGENFAIAPWV